MLKSNVDVGPLNYWSILRKECIVIVNLCQILSWLMTSPLNIYAKCLNVGGSVINLYHMSVKRMTLLDIFLYIILYSQGEHFVEMAISAYT